MDVPNEVIAVAATAFAGLAGAVTKLYVDVRASNKALADSIQERVVAAEKRLQTQDETQRILADSIEKLEALYAGQTRGTIPRR